MALYKLTQAAVVGDRYYGAGEEVEYDGTPGPHMEPVDADAKKAADAAAKAVAPAPDPDKLAHPAERTTPGTESSRPVASPAPAPSRERDRG